jgi:methionyl-tRNA formyltransferase
MSRRGSEISVTKGMMRSTDPEAGSDFRIGWIGFHQEGLCALEALLNDGVAVSAVLTLAPDLAARRSGTGDYASLCRKFGVPLETIRDINDSHSQALLRDLSLDLAFVIGWTQIVRPEVIALARLGMIGAHASMLPDDRGRAPINWALIQGKTVTGNSLIWLAEDVDGGDIIDQTSIPISPYDTCSTLYEEVAKSTRDMILRTLPWLIDGKRPGRPQLPGGGDLLPGRRPADGLVDWSRNASTVYDFIRALTRPYPGAFSWLDRSRYLIWQAALPPPGLVSQQPAGTVIGPVVSPLSGACGQAVACGNGALILLEIENEQGALICGRPLSERRWTGQSWHSNVEARVGSRGTS